jgi:CAAX protease family protein
MTSDTVAIPEMPSRKPIAPVWHTVVFLAVFAALAAAGWRAQQAARLQPQGHLPQTRLLPLQVQAIVFEWSCVGWVWFGVRRRGVRLRDLIAGRWASPKAVLLDSLLGATVCIVWLAVTTATNVLFGADRSVVPFPVGVVEIVLAVLVAVSAGVCEEIVFRGYFLRQFRALTGSVVAAVFLQALVFGPGHFYQGVRVTSLATLYALVFGVLAVWRRSLRPGMAAHTLSDLLARVFRIG